MSIDVKSAWVRELVGGWPFPEAERREFLAATSRIPESVTCRGAFGARLLELIQEERGHKELEVCMSVLNLDAWPDSFRMMPLDQMTLICGEAMARLGGGPKLASSAEAVTPALSNAMNAVAQALMRSTMPSFNPDAFLRELLKVLADMMSGSLFSALEVTPEKRDGLWTLRLEQEHFFLAHHFYPSIFWDLTGGPYGPVKSVDFDWDGPTSATVRFVI